MIRRRASRCASSIWTDGSIVRVAAAGQAASHD
jgi:hypothetical protein